MIEGRYVYCILEADVEKRLGNVGLFGGEVHAVKHKDISAMVSPVEFKEIETSLDNILVHQQVVESCRGISTTLPVKFGVIFKSEDGVKTLLEKSYTDYRTKLTTLKGKDEFGIKVILNDVALKKIRSKVADESSEIGKIKKDLSRAKRGTSYLLNIRMDEALRNETYRKIDEMSREIHNRLAKAPFKGVPLKSEHEQIILNGAYLIDRPATQKFRKEVEKIKEDFEKEGLVIHLSGPWAPYSFC